MATRFNIQSWSYSGRPSVDNPKDVVRFLIGDTNPEDKQLDDCEIQYLLAMEGDPLSAAICAVYGLIALYSRDFDGKFGDSQSAKPAEAYRALLDDLLAKRARQPVKMYAGGLSRSEKQAEEVDTDRVRPAFTRATGANRRAIQPNNETYYAVEGEP